MTNETKSKKYYDLEERTFRFARSVFDFINVLPKTIINTEIIKQVIRSSGSVGVNYIEANEALSKKDFAFRIKICLKEAKETLYWLKLMDVKGEDITQKQQALISEVTELMKIFGSII
ncbi:MAG: four helix bundle protein, partial [Chloroflexi bacterium RBG_16_50_11]